MTLAKRPPAPVARESPRRARFGRALRVAAQVLLALLAMASLSLAYTPTGRATTRAAFLLPALITGSEPAALVTLGEPIAHTSDVIFSQDGPVYLDIFAPTTPVPAIPGAREGLVIIPGVGDNRTVPQLVNLMQSLARAGVVAVEMTTNTLIAYDLAQPTLDAVVQATLYTQHIHGVSSRRVGLVGFSAGGSLACLAATDPRIRDTLTFVTSFGGYFDATNLLADTGRRALTVDGHESPWAVNGVPVQTLTNVIADALPGEDATLLRSGFVSAGIALTPAQIAQLSPPGQAAYHLLAGDEPDRVGANIAALPPSLLASLRNLSPVSAISRMRAPVYLLHDRSDQFVAFTESRDFDAALTRAGKPHSYAEFSIFQHVEVKSGNGVGQTVHDGWSLFQILIRVMQPSS